MGHGERFLSSGPEFPLRQLQIRRRRLKQQTQLAIANRLRMGWTHTTRNSLSKLARHRGETGQNAESLTVLRALVSVASSTKPPSEPTQFTSHWMGSTISPRPFGAALVDSRT